MAIIGIFEIFLAALCYIACCWLRNRKKLIRSWPLIGMLPSLLFNMNRIPDWIIGLTGRKEGTYLFKGPWFTGMYVMGTTDPANLKHITSTNFSNYPKGPEFKEMYFDILGDGIFNSDSDLWKNQRKPAAAHFSHERFKKFLFKTASDKVEKGLISVLEHVCKKGVAVDMEDVVHRFTADVTFTLVTGYDQNTLSLHFPDDKLGTALENIEEAMFFRHIQPKILWKLQRWIGFGTEKKIKKAVEDVNQITSQYIAMKREQVKCELGSGNGDGDGEGSVDLLSSYVKEGSKIEDKFLRDTILSFMIAGRENSLTWFFWLLSKNPRVEAKIREELKSIAPENETGENPQFFDIEKVSKLLYLHAALCETLRFYPPVPYEHKVPLQADILPSGHCIDPKMKIFFSSYLMGRLKSLWGEDCLEFKPERWISPENGRIIQQSPHKFLAFNAGPRTCLGKEIAFIEMKAMAAFVVHNYNVQVVEGHPVVPKFTSIILHMKHGLLVSISRRWA